MNIKTISLTAVLVFLSATILAAQEYPLVYKAFEPGDEVAAGGSNQLQPLPQPPEGLRGLPEAEGRHLHYLRAELGEGEDNVFNMVVALASDGSQAVLLADTDQDRDFSDESSRTATIEQDWIRFPPVDVTVKAAGNERPYRFAVDVYVRGEDAFFMMYSRCCYRGKIVIDEVEYHISLSDGNCDGLFNSAGWEGDRLLVTRKTGKGGYLWNSSPRVVVVEGEWHFFEPAADGTSIHYAGAARDLVPLRTGFEKFVLEVMSERSGCVTLDTTEGAVMLPPGDYQWGDYWLLFEDDGGKPWSFVSGTIMREPFCVPESKEGLDLPLCLPVRQNLSARTKGDLVMFEEQIVGRDGENVYVSYGDDDDDLPPPSFTITDRGGKQVGGGSFEAG